MTEKRSDAPRRATRTRRSAASEIVHDSMTGKEESATSARPVIEDVFDEIAGVHERDDLHDAPAPKPRRTRKTVASAATEGEDAPEAAPARRPRGRRPAAAVETVTGEDRVPVGGSSHFYDEPSARPEVAAEEPVPRPRRGRPPRRTEAKPAGDDGGDFGSGLDVPAEAPRAAAAPAPEHFSSQENFDRSEHTPRTEHFERSQSGERYERSEGFPTDGDRGEGQQGEGSPFEGYAPRRGRGPRRGYGRDRGDSNRESSYSGDGPHDMPQSLLPQQPNFDSGDTVPSYGGTGFGDEHSDFAAPRRSEESSQEEGRPGEGYAPREGESGGYQNYGGPNQSGYHPGYQGQGYQGQGYQGQQGYNDRPYGNNRNNNRRNNNRRGRGQYDNGPGQGGPQGGPQNRYGNNRQQGNNYRGGPNQNYGNRQFDQRRGNQGFQQNREFRDQNRERGPEVVSPTSGVLELHPKGYGFLRDAKVGYMSQESDPFVSSTLIQKLGIREGVLIQGEMVQGGRGQGPRVKTIEYIDGRTPEDYAQIKSFDDLTPINPFEQIRLETGPAPLTMRIMDLLTPVGKGQRALIVAPPRSGKTMLLQDIANAVSTNHPEIYLIVLLIDERPEEVTEMRRRVKGDVIASSMDREVENHIRVSQLIFERAKRLTEEGRDVFILLDSITRTARAFNKGGSNTGRTMTGGLDIKAMDIPKKMFGTARRFEEGGSLTVVGTALIDTGSKMDEVIFQEFKGTGNMEMVLSRDLADRRIWPAIDITKSGTRREEKILSPDVLDGVTMLRRSLISLSPVEAMEQLTRILAKYKTNEEFLAKVKSIL